MLNNIKSNIVHLRKEKEKESNIPGPAIQAHRPPLKDFDIDLLCECFVSRCNIPIDGGNKYVSLSLLACKKIFVNIWTKVVRWVLKNVDGILLPFQTTQEKMNSVF